MSGSYIRAVQVGVPAVTRLSARTVARGRELTAGQTHPLMSSPISARRTPIPPSIDPRWPPILDGTERGPNRLFEVDRG
jgi:hypothetical protein